MSKHILKEKDVEARLNDEFERELAFSYGLNTNKSLRVRTNLRRRRTYFVVLDRTNKKEHIYPIFKLKKAVEHYNKLP